MVANNPWCLQGDENTEDLPRHIAGTFDRVAEGYDGPSLRFFPFSADGAVFRLRVRPGEKVLDVATGSGSAAIAAAQYAMPGGRVTGIDLSQGMLDKAFENARARGLPNIDLHRMDGAAPEFRSGYFHAVLCTAGIFFLPDMLLALRQWRRVLRPGGRVLFTAFTDRAFQPMARLYVQALRAAGAVFPAPGMPLYWHRLGSPEACRGLLQEAGFENIETSTVQHGFHLKNANEWWEVVWNSSLRGSLDALAPEVLARLREAHTREVDELAGDDGIWMDVETIYARGHKPEKK